MITRSNYYFDLRRIPARPKWVLTVYA